MTQMISAAGHSLYFLRLIGYPAHHSFYSPHFVEYKPKLGFCPLPPKMLDDVPTVHKILSSSCPGPYREIQSTLIRCLAMKYPPSPHPKKTTSDQNRDERERQGMMTDQWVLTSLHTTTPFERPGDQRPYPSLILWAYLEVWLINGCKSSLDFASLSNVPHSDIMGSRLPLASSRKLKIQQAVELPLRGFPITFYFYYDCKWWCG